MPESHTQVLIVGGGIVGLSASLFLSGHGINSILVERHTGTSIHPRARGLNARTMELYHEIGVDEAVREAGASLNLSMGIYKGTTLASVVGPHKRKVTDAEPKFPGTDYFQTVCPVIGTRGTQDKIEPVLLANARDRGGDLRFNTDCVTIEQDEARVTATLRHRSDNTQSTIHADYLIAADGAGSPIRQNLGYHTTGAGTLGHLLNILFEADLGSFVRGREFSICLIEHEDVRGLFTSINNDERWVFHLSYDPKRGEKIEDFTFSRCEELIKIALDIPDIRIIIKSILPWEPTVRVAEKFKLGRVFLAGDAAHQMPPWGGQGATSGIADVHNLAWKLAAVLTQQASPDLLATYDTERVPITRLVSEESGNAADKYGLLSMKKSFKSISNFCIRVPRLSGFGYTYTSSTINTDDTTPMLWRLARPIRILPWALSLCGAPGTRAPHIWVCHNGERISTLDLFGTNFVLIAGADGHDWCKVSARVSSLLNIELKSYRASPKGELVCSRNSWENSAWISSKGALLIRPDGFIAWRAWRETPNLEHKLTDVLMQALCRKADGSSIDLSQRDILEV